MASVSGASFGQKRSFFDEIVAFFEKPFDSGYKECPELKFERGFEFDVEFCKTPP